MVASRFGSYTASQPQQTLGNQALLRLQQSGTLRTKRAISQPGDPSEREADRIAEQVMRMPEVAPSIRKKQCAPCAAGGPPCPNCREEPGPPIQRAAGKSGEGSAPESLLNRLGPGRPLDSENRRFFEPRFGADFSRVRVHADPQAAAAARSVSALAFTAGRDLVFSEGRYAPGTSEGRKLLAHELTHVVQRQGNGRRLDRKEGDPPAQPKIDYAKAEKFNKRYAASLGWDVRLAEVRSDWAALWSSGNANAFADAVAAFQAELGFKGTDIDGVLGGGTWRRLRPIGEVIVETGVGWEDSKSVCTAATKERLTKGYKRATGEELVPKEERSTFNIILQSIASRMLDVDEEYRGTGAAGALVYLGQGEFVSQSDIWDVKALLPGAAMQVWKKQSDYDGLKKGTEVSSWGTSFVFLSYAGDDAMKILHFDRVETMKKGSFEVWIGANLTAR